jgi:molybdopterin synthase sulfur carrier subunit
MTQLLFFGRLRDIAGYSAITRDLPASVVTVADLRAWIGNEDPLLGGEISAPHVRVAVNQAMCVSDQACVRGADEVAFMPPLSGG